MNERYKVVITDFVTEPSLEQEVLEDVADIEALGATSEAELRGKIEAADALMVFHYLRVGQETIERLERCQVLPFYTPPQVPLRGTPGCPVFLFGD